MVPEKPNEVIINVDEPSSETLPVSSSNPETQASYPSSSSQTNMSPIVQLLQNQELGKALLTFVVPMTMGLLQNLAMKGSFLWTSHLILISLCVGSAGLWNGLLLRSFFPRLSNLVEQLGVALIFLSFFGVIGSFLPPEMVWACWVCYALWLVPFILIHLPVRESREGLPVTS